MGRKVRNLLGTILLITAVIVTQIPVTDVEAVTTASTSDFQMDGTTLVKYYGTAEDVSISNYVEKIEAEAFYGNEYVKRVVIGDSVESIGARAFADCVNLQSVTVPDSVVSIDTAAFSSCPSLQAVSIGSGLKSLGNGSFSGDYSLQQVGFSSSNPKFTCDDGAIYDKNGRTVLYQVLSGRKGSSYQLPSTVEEIKPYAFWGNYNLENVSLGNNALSIPACAFANCKNLKNVDIPYSVKTIDMKAFESCVRLRSITIPPSVNYIHSTAFDGCTKLNIIAEPGTEAEAYAAALVLEDIEVSEYEEAPIPSASGNGGENGAGESAQAKEPVNYYHEVTHMNPLEEEQDSSVIASTRIIGQQAFVLVDNAKAEVNVGDTGATLGGSAAENVQGGETIFGMEGSEDAKGGSFPKYTVVNGEVIAAQAYYDDPMVEYRISDNITRIGEFAFARSGIMSVDIPEGVKEIGYAAFYHCDDLENVVIPQSVEEIEPSAFEKTPWLSGWMQNVGNGTDFLVVGDGILLAYKGSNPVVAIPDNVKQIGADAFRGHTEIAKVMIPDGVSVIGEAAFADCSSLTAIEGANGVREIRDRAFAGCPIASLTIPASVESIGLRAFDSEGTSRGEGAGVVVFESDVLPTLSYETTATKLYRDAFRDLALKGSEIAVVPESVTELDGTVLEAGKSGFEGAVCHIAKEPTESESGVLEVVQQSGVQSLEGRTYRIGGRDYVVRGGVGAQSAGEGLSDGTDAGSSEKGTVAVRISSSTMPQDSLASAVMEGSEDNFILNIVDSESAKAEISDAYRKIYGNKLPANLCGYEMSLKEEETDIPITGLGKQEMSVTIPLPSGVGGNNLHVVCLDADGQLEEVASRIVSMDGTDYIAFTAKHFSPYGVYNYASSGGASANVENGQAVFTSLGNKDDSPDTGDHSIHPKWFLGIGLLFASLAVFFYRKKV